MIYELPTVIAFEPISRCFLEYEFCILKELKTYEVRKKFKMDFSEFKKIIDDVSYFTTDIQFSGGEPLLNNKDIFDMIKYAEEKQINTLFVSNAQLLTDENIEKLLDAQPSKMLLAYEAPDKKVYEKIRQKGNFEILKRNIINLIKEKNEKGYKKPIIISQMVVIKKISLLLINFGTKLSKWDLTMVQ